MKRVILLLATLLTTNTAIADAFSVPKKVFISQVVDHPALNATTKGMIDALADRGFKAGETLEIRVESAQGSTVLASQIASKFIANKPDVVVGVGTVSAQSFTKAAIEGKVKLIFSSVTDPLGAGLVQTLDKPGNNTSGVSNFVDLAPQLALIQKLQPQLTRLGIVYNPGEANSSAILKKLEELCPEMDIVLIKQAAPKTADVPQAATKLATRVDAIFISNDNTALSALQSVIRAASSQPYSHIPVYVSDTDAVDLGAFAALGPNQYDVGVQTGQMIARVLNGEKIGETPVEFPKQTDLYLNVEAAQFAQIQIPENLRVQATRLVEKSKP